MRKTCPCGNTIPLQVYIDGVVKITRNRSNCLTCVPFGSSPYGKRLDPERKVQRNREKVKRDNIRFFKENGIGRAHLLRKNRKKMVLDHLGGKCLSCGYGRCNRNLVFHHMGGKEFDLSERSFQFSWEKLIPEIKKCVLICHNCHGEVHDGLLDVSPQHKTVVEMMETFTVRLPLENTLHKHLIAGKSCEVILGTPRAPHRVPVLVLVYGAENMPIFERMDFSFRTHDLTDPGFNNPFLRPPTHPNQNRSGES